MVSDEASHADAPDELMRILLLPNVGLKLLTGDSSHRFMVDFIEVVRREAAGKCWFTLVLPGDADLVEAGWVDSYPRYKFTSMGTWPPLVQLKTKVPNVSVMLEPWNRSWNHQERYVDQGIVDRFSRMYGTDVTESVVTHRARVGPQLTGLNDDRRADKGVVPVWYWETNASLYPRERTQEALQAMHYALVHPLFLTNLEKDIAGDLCREYLSPSQVGEFYRRAKTIAQPANLEYLDTVVAAADADRAAHPPDLKDDPFVLFFGSRFSAVKRIPQVIESFDSVLSAGHNVRVVMTTSTASWMTEDFLDPVRYPYVELTADCARDEFFAKAARGHAFVSHGLDGHECHGVSFIQKLYLGLAASFPEAEKWPREILPDWYPYWHRSQRDAHMWLTTFEKRWRATGSCWLPGELERLREFIRNRCGDVKVVEPVWQMIVDERARQGTSLPGKGIVSEGLDRLDKRLERWGWVGLNDLEKSMATVSTGGFKPMPGRQRRQGFPTLYETYRIATDVLGLEDAFDGPEIRLRRPGATMRFPEDEPVEALVES